MPRTAPTVDGTPPLKQVSIRWIDAEGDRRADAYEIPPDATDAEIEALVAALAAASNANIWQVAVTDLYGNTPQTSAADNEPSPTVYTNVVLTAKASDNDTARMFIPAPNSTIVVIETDTVDVASPEFIAARDAFLLLLASPAGKTFVPVSVRYTERKEINAKQNL